MCLRSRAPMPCWMNQRPSLVWLIEGVWFGVSTACRQVSRHRGARRMVQNITSSSVFLAQASCTASDTSWPSPVRIRCSSAARMPTASCSPAMWYACQACGAIGGVS